MTLRQELSKQTADATVIIVAQRISTIGSHDGLAQLAEIDLVAGGVGLLRVELLVACVLAHLLALSSHLALGLACVEEFLVALSECVG